MFWIECWVPHLGTWVTVEAAWSVLTARAVAEDNADTYGRVYRVTDDLRREYGRFTGERCGDPES